MKKSEKYIAFVGKYDKEEYLVTHNDYIVNSANISCIEKYSLIFINDDIKVIENDEPIIKNFNSELSNSMKEAYLAYLVYMKGKQH